MIFLVFILLLYSFTAHAHVPAEKLSDQLKFQISNSEPNYEVLVWIFFKDKGSDADKYFLKPEAVISEKSLLRRAKVTSSNSLIEDSDIPVSTKYIEQIQAIGFKLKQKSKWFNAVSGSVSVHSLNSISALPFVKQIDLVARFPKSYEDVGTDFNIDINSSTQKDLQKPNALDYGNSLTQLQQINVPALHNLGYTGQGVTICLMDAGFNRLSHEVFSTMNIIAAYDFVNNDTGVGDSTDQGIGTHGTQTLSVIGGFKEGKLIGPAFGADYILAKTENTFSETPVEEDNWIAALEWADSIGVDVTSTSLSYLDYDPPFISYTWENMDGNTARITIAADLAVKKGIAVFNSAGNNGFNSLHNTISSPADGDSVIAVGAVNSLGTRASFSSVGNTVDGRIKPDIMAMGSNVALASVSGDANYSFGSGTSFSCPLAAGVAALLLSFNPDLTPMQVRDALRNTASRNQNPDREYGWGIIDALKAINSTVPVELLSFNAEVYGNEVFLSWLTATESNSRGFSIERAKENSSFLEIGFINSAGSSSSKRTYQFSNKIYSAGKYYYRLKQIDFDGSFSYSNEVEITISTPNNFYVLQNYPNPFNPSTKVKYAIPMKSSVSLNLYDVLGHKIGQLFDGEAEAGEYEIILNSNDFSPGLTSGVYFLRLETENFQKSIKITLVK